MGIDSGSSSTKLSVFNTEKQPIAASVKLPDFELAITPFFFGWQNQYKKGFRSYCKGILQQLAKSREAAYFNRQKL
ncbi:hypothetical protein ACLI09_11260 [Flavobacterium sp. RHBU_24]|uniref:hypothetical protein n=1 Tax=Flavobacterium sp. RHBU_24 TaxID=3391185 RepID=UPI0039851962